MPFEWLVQLTPPLKKRAFSISSSPLVHPNQIHLTVSVVSWLTPFKRARHGLCSTWLAGLSPNEGMNSSFNLTRRPLYFLPYVLFLDVTTPSGAIITCTNSTLLWSPKKKHQPSLSVTVLMCRKSYTMLGTQRIPASSASICSSCAHWTRNRMRTFSSICRGKGCTECWRTNSSCHVLLWL